MGLGPRMFKGAFEGDSSRFRRAVAWLRSLVFSKLRAADVAKRILAELDADLSRLPPQWLEKGARTLKI